jgi:KUP system potassium uptake protein
MNDVSADNVLPQEAADGQHGPKEPLPKLMLGAIGVVYGDIGTSPLYTMNQSFLGPHPLAVDKLHIFGVLSLIFWTLMMIVTFKYVSVAMRADNRGEGGSFALLSLIARNLEGKKKWTPTLVLLGVLATCLFYGDAMITPAISVLSVPDAIARHRKRRQHVRSGDARLFRRARGAWGGEHFAPSRDRRNPQPALGG